MYRWPWHVYCYIKVKYKNKNIIHLMLPNCHKADSLTNYDYQRFDSTKSINLDRFRENLAVTLTLKIPIWIPRPIRKQFKGRKYQEDRSLASNWLLLRHAQHSPSSLQRLLVHRLQPLLWFVLIQPEQIFRKLLQNLDHHVSNLAIQMKTMNCRKRTTFSFIFLHEKVQMYRGVLLNKLLVYCHVNVQVEE